MPSLDPVLLAQDIAGYVLVIALGLTVVLILFFLIFARYFRLYIQSVTSGAGIGLFDLIGMTLRKVNINTIMRARIMAVQAGLDIPARLLESHFLAGGNVPKVVRAVISAHRAEIPMDFAMACRIDLDQQHDVYEAVQTTVNPKVIYVPDPSKGRTHIDAVAKDGIQLKVRALVTVKTNIQQIIGGASEDTIVARVGQGIVTTIGSSQSYKYVLEHPEEITKHVLREGLDAGTAFEILSIDIASVDVGINVGARLQADQAEADLQRFRAIAEKKRAQAVAREQEMLARVQENRAGVVLAESEVPRAISDAFRAGPVRPQHSGTPLAGGSNGTADGVS